MSEMVEKVAKALAVKSHMADWVDIGEGSKDVILMLARAAIEAMRDPTDEMAESGAGTQVFFGWKGANAPECADIYRAMIDAALK